LKLSLATPFFLSQPLTLDGLLSAAVHNKTGLFGPENWMLIPLEREQGIYKASALFCEARYRHAPFGRVMALRGAGDLSTHLFAPNKHGGKEYGLVDQVRGSYRTRMSSYSGIAASEVFFWGVGDVGKTLHLLQNYILGIGKRSNAGAGQIVSMQAQELPEDRSWVTAKGKPARPLPLWLWQALGGNTDMPTIPLAVAPPYWEREKVDAVFPESWVA
jgi:CRISPR type IV-associated protein Csf3